MSNPEVGRPPEEAVKKPEEKSKKGKKGVDRVLTDKTDFDIEISKKEISQPLQVDPETGIYKDESGNEWASIPFFVNKYGIGYLGVSGKLREVSQIMRSPKMKAKLFSVSEAEKILKEHVSLPMANQDDGTFIDDEGEVWGPIGHLKHLGVDEGFIRSRHDEIPTFKGRTKKDLECTFYNLKIGKKLINEHLALPQVDKDGVYVDDSGQKWAPTIHFRRKFGLSHALVKRVKEKIRTIKGKTRDKVVNDLYNIDDVVNEYKDFLEIPIVNENGLYVDKDGILWGDIPYLEKEFNIGRAAIEARLGSVKKLDGRALKGGKFIIFNVEEARAALAEFLSLPQVNEDGVYADKDGNKWVTTSFLEANYGDTTIKLFQNFGNIAVMRGRGASGRGAQLYKLDEVDSIINDFYSLPQLNENNEYIDEAGIVWMHITALADKIGLHPLTVLSHTKGFSQKRGRTRGGRETILYNAAEAEKILGVSSALNKRQARIEKEKLKGLDQNLVGFVSEIADGQTPTAQQFQSLIRALGVSRCADILYKFRPEFRGLPVEHVQGVIADYLGDYLVVRRGFRLEDVEAVAPYLSDLTFQEGLFEALKDNCLRYYFEERRKGRRDNEGIVYGYIDHATTALSHVRSKEIDDVIEKVVAHFDSVFSKFHKPEQFVGALNPDREFPDINQRINIKELAEKRRLLIADEMGLGKSASVIMAKEQLGARCALVVAPSNVIATWRRYLSDNHEEGGYYKTGQAPRVLIVESPRDLEGVTADAYDFILFSQGRINERYTPALQAIDYDMMIIDEVHKLKSITGARAPQLMRLAEKIKGENQYLALLSGTPVPNKIEDLAVILKLLYPDKFSEIDDREFVRQIINGDIVNLRSLLVPRMQAKSLEEGVEMPALREENIRIEMTPLEKEVYEVLLEDDELEPTEKMRILRQFLLNPELIDSTPGIESAKIENTSRLIREAFVKNNKVVLFVNDYIEDVIRGAGAITEKLHLPEGVEIRIIHGGVLEKEREKIQKEFNSADKKILLVVSGQTADVGVDYSGADHVFFYNEPWTEYQRRQELARAYRPGLVHDLASETVITAGTIEEGMHEYILRKYKAVEKLLRGIPTTDLEKELLEKDEKSKEPDLSVNPELAEYYFSSWDKMMKIFGYVKEIGEPNFKKFLEKYACDYAGGYADLGNRSYQANANRVAGTVIHELAKETGVSVSSLKILDLGSGPEMLRRHIGDEYCDRVFSLDINREHFAGREAVKGAAGSILAVPFTNQSFDYANLSLSLHYTNFAPSRGRLERLQALTEMNRVLKIGGKAVVNIIYSLKFKDFGKFKEAIDTLGFRIIDNYTGDVVEGGQYKSQVVTLEKVKNIEPDLSVDDISEQLGKDKKEGLKFTKSDAKIKDSRRILTSFELAGRRFSTDLNQQDQLVLQEEKEVLDQGNSLKQRFGGVKEIPAQEIIDNNFVRIRAGEKYILFKKLTRGSGVVIVR